MKINELPKGALVQVETPVFRMRGTVVPIDERSIWVTSKVFDLKVTQDDLDSDDPESGTSIMVFDPTA